MRKTEQLERYHKGVYWPSYSEKLLSQFNNKQKSLSHSLSPHILEDRSYRITPQVKNFFDNIQLNVEDIIEYRRDDNYRVNRALYRTQLDENHDISFVLFFNGTIKTFWVNNKTDHHKTLDTSIYTTAIILNKIGKRIKSYFKA